jgi:hypothetical protein
VLLHKSFDVAAINGHAAIKAEDAADGRQASQIFPLDGTTAIPPDAQRAIYFRRNKFLAISANPVKPIFIRQ